MSTLTKEWLHQTIAELEEERDAVPGVVNEDAVMVLAAMKLALASLEAEPVAWRMRYRSAHCIGGWVFSDTYGEPPKGYEIESLYTATPAPAPVSVPDAIHSQGEKSVGDDYYALGWNACRAVMLQGSDGALTDEDTKQVGELVIWVKRLAH